MLRLPQSFGSVGFRRIGAASLVWLATLAFQAPMASARDAESADAPITVRAAFDSADGVKQGKSVHYRIDTGRTALVDIGGRPLRAIALVTDSPTPFTLIVRSTVVRLSRKDFVLFYPLVTLVAEDFTVGEPLRPRFEFAFARNELTNEFTIPAGTLRLLVHSAPEFFDSDFTSSTALRGGDSVAAAGFFLGVIGIAMAQGEERQFRFAESGKIRIGRD